MKYSRQTLNIMYNSALLGKKKKFKKVFKNSFSEEEEGITKNLLKSDIFLKFSNFLIS